MRLYTLVVLQEGRLRFTHHKVSDARDRDAVYEYFKKLLPEDMKPYLEDAMYYGKEKCGGGGVLLYTSWGLD
ncbi:hypothetical protein HOU35_gp064 [Acinetobacter phage vB_AbaM_B09_Aci05]|uniref:Uncharacterized protein n=1 Tax=Acinetobacter phage vB_AbaM_B09_Aci05 TaxID=2315458 RepID=A0A386KAM1_9CAUD|nr:hypothetical protein HOU35_gp064 [Acinetobacter phage vB_AbaM_B09_Aci05]AYD82441.1 hypothetical protein Aci05_113 [Acinetobacter phage vB_AbaM_B09_Aci05]